MSGIEKETLKTVQQQSSITEREQNTEAEDRYKQAHGKPIQIGKDGKPIKEGEGGGWTKWIPILLMAFGALIAALLWFKEHLLFEIPKLFTNFPKLIEPFLNNISEKLKSFDDLMKDRWKSLRELVDRLTGKKELPEEPPGKPPQERPEEKIEDKLIEPAKQDLKEKPPLERDALGRFMKRKAEERVRNTPSTPKQVGRDELGRFTKLEEEPIPEIIKESPKEIPIKPIEPIKEIPEEIPKVVPKETPTVPPTEVTGGAFFRGYHKAAKFASNVGNLLAAYEGRKAMNEGDFAKSLGVGATFSGALAGGKIGARLAGPPSLKLTGAIGGSALGAYGVNNLEDKLKEMFPTATENINSTIQKPLEWGANAFRKILPEPGSDNAKMLQKVLKSYDFTETLGSVVDKVVPESIKNYFSPKETPPNPTIGQKLLESSEAKRDLDASSNNAGTTNLNKNTTNNIVNNQTNTSVSTSVASPRDTESSYLRSLDNNYAFP